MKLIDLVRKNRSIRRFNESHVIDRDELLNLIDHARLSASGRNQQSLKYIISNQPAQNEKIFPLLGWAGFIKEWDGPAKGERPSAYIIVLHDNQIASNHYCDEGIAMQSITLAAAEADLGCCMIASVDRTKLRDILSIPEHLKILNVVAIGKPAEQVVLEELRNNDYKYWRDDQEVHHVPKRPLSGIVLSDE